MVKDSSYYGNLNGFNGYIEGNEEINYPSNLISNYDWDFSNKVLYELCSNCPTHKIKYEVLAKIFFIGRIYAAAIERRKNKKSDEIQTIKGKKFSYVIGNPPWINWEDLSENYRINNNIVQEQQIKKLIQLKKS